MKILFATDGSECSFAAMETMFGLVSCVDKLDVMVVSVYEEQYAIAAEPFAISGEFYQQMLDMAAGNAQHFVDGAAKTIRERLDRPGVEVETKIAVGPPEREIVNIARDWHADLIVVGSHGRGFWGRMLGSVSDGVIHHAPCSVLVVRGGKKSEVRV